MLELVVDVMYFCDILVTFRTGVEVKDSDLIDLPGRPTHGSPPLSIEWEPTKIATIYLRGWFALDLLSTIPFDRFIGSDWQWRGLKALRVLKLARVVRVIQGLGRLAERGGGDIGEIEGSWEWQQQVRRQWQLVRRRMATDPNVISALSYLGLSSSSTDGVGEGDSGDMLLPLVTLGNDDGEKDGDEQLLEGV